MDLPLPDQNPGLVDGLGKSKLEHLGLETTLKEILLSSAKAQNQASS